MASSSLNLLNMRRTQWMSESSEHQARDHPPIEIHFPLPFRRRSLARSADRGVDG